ncbi:MAG: hypothetical protein AAF267_20700, partial [Deinococcota bacterium]
KTLPYLFWTKLPALWMLNRSDLQCSTDGITFNTATCAGAGVTHVRVVYDETTAVPVRTQYNVNEILTLQFVARVP